MKKALQIGGIAAGVVLIAFGIAAVVLGANGRSTVNSNLKQEFIVGSPDMTSQAIAPEIKTIQASQQKIAAEQKQAKLPASQQFTFTDVSAPSCSVAGDTVNDGTSARCFAQFMRIHALGSSNGLTYAQMGRFQAKSDAPIQFTDFNGGTNDDKYAVVDTKTGQPVSNGVRNVWVTETALTTALNASYMADKLSVFGIVVGIALLLSGIGFLILALSGAIQRVPLTKEKPTTDPLVPATGTTK
jgi:uncharacterized iron-regulated membrane protein